MNSLVKAIPFLLLFNGCQTFRSTSDISIYDLYPNKDREIKKLNDEVFWPEGIMKPLNK